ncbi:unnamed protein product [Sphagnum jensenii]
MYRCYVYRNGYNQPIGYYYTNEYLLVVVSSLVQRQRMVTNGVIPVGTLYTWTAPTGVGLTGGLTQASAVNTITGTLVNTTSSAQTATYLVTPISGVCVGMPFSFTVMVNPGAVIGAMSTTTCSGVTFTITPTDGVNGVIPAGTTFTWTTPTGAGFTGGASQTTGLSYISGTLTNTTNIARTAIYLVSPNIVDCGIGTSFTLTVTINPTAVINAITTVSCSGVAFTISPVDGTNGIVPAGTTYSWSAPSVTGALTGGLSGTGASFISGGATGSGAAFISGTLTNSTNVAQTATYIVTPSTVNCGSAPSFTVTVTINPVATVTPMSTTICTGITFSVTPTNGVNGVIPAGTTFTWSAPTGTGIAGGATQITGVSNVTGTLTNTTSSSVTATYLVTPNTVNCGASAVFSVTVTIIPGATINQMTTTICTGVTFGLTPVDGVNGIIPSGTLYTWTAPTGAGVSGGATQITGVTSISGTLTNTTGSPVTATYIVTPSTACGISPAFTVVVTINPIATITPMSGVAYSGVLFSVTPTDVVNGNVPVGTTYTWPVPSITGGVTGGTSGTAAATINGTLDNPTNSNQTATYLVTPSSACGSGSVFSVTLTVYPRQQSPPYLLLPVVV